MDNPRVIGHVVSVRGFRVQVELLPETRSALRATLDGVQLAVGINSYLSFSIGAGQKVIGVITDLEARESYDPSTGDELSLELLKPRRVASVQLLGTLEEQIFNPGITILPTLDIPAEVGTPGMLKAILETPPRRNKPEDYDGADFDRDLPIGAPTGHGTTRLCASFNDLLSRPLAIVGNTGSGKSFTVTSVLQRALQTLGGSDGEPHVFVLDINGEYGRAFGVERPSDERVPNRVYLNGEEFGIPVWLFNAEEVCAWLTASEQTQEPVLKDWWAIAKAKRENVSSGSHRLGNAVSAIDHLVSELTKVKRKAAGSYCDAICGHLDGSEISTDGLEELFRSHRGVDQYNMEVLTNQAAIIDELENIKRKIKYKTSGQSDQYLAQTADSPVFIAVDALRNPTLTGRALLQGDVGRIEGYLTTLRLRLRTRLDDQRWHSFFNYEDEVPIDALEHWFGRFGFGRDGAQRVSIIDLSMLSNEVLPYACAVIGRVLLEARERLPAGARFQHPWVIVLEEAHNYARPARVDEGEGQRLSRHAYERIAKEGRKFGLSLIVASQRPSEVSPTVTSQCANFVSHRLQNPDDIEHFRRIIPLQARRLLDQVTTLASGEAIVFGSAFHIPVRVQMNRPDPGPYSQTAAPFHEWRKEGSFPLAEVSERWGTQPSSSGSARDSEMERGGEGR